MPMAHPALRNPVNLAWIVLMATTFGSWWLGADHSEDSWRQLATASVIVLAFIKVQLVGSYFMELRSAPALLQALFASWVVAIGGGLVLMYLLS